MADLTIDDVLDKNISFEPITEFAGVVGRNFKNVVITESLSFTGSSRFGNDVLAIHQNLIRMVPAGTIPNDPTRYRYVLVKFPNGSEQVVGMPWIDWSTIVIHAAQKILVEVGNVKPTDLELIRQQLAAVNLQITNIQIVDI